MDSEDIIRRKAQAFDALAELFRELDKGAGFASSNWVIFSEAMEKELREIEAI